MKILSVLATALFAASAFAGTSTVYHDYDSVLREIALDNACITQTDVKSIKPVRVCTKLEPVTNHNDDTPYTEWKCTKWATTQLSYPRTFQRTVCAEMHDSGEAGATCVKWVTKTETMPATIKVRVVTDHGEASDFPGQTYKHTFPACK